MVNPGHRSIGHQPPSQLELVFGQNRDEALAVTYRLAAGKAEHQTVPRA